MKMLLACCRYGLSQATINKLFQPKLRNFNSFNPRTNKPSLVRSSIPESNVIPKRNHAIVVKGDRFRKADKIPEGYRLIYREKYVSLIATLQCSAYLFIPSIIYKLICFQFEKDFTLSDLGFDFSLSDLGLDFSLSDLGLDFSLENFSSYIPFFNSPEKKDNDENVTDSEITFTENFTLSSRQAFTGDVYLLYFMIIISNIYLLKTSLRTPLRIYKKGTDCIAVFSGLLGPWNKSYLHFKPHECRPIQQLPGLIWRRWQVKIKNKYYMVIPNNFKTTADLNTTCIPIPVPTFLNKVLKSIGL